VDVDRGVGCSSERPDTALRFRDELAETAPVLLPTSSSRLFSSTGDRTALPGAAVDCAGEPAAPSVVSIGAAVGAAVGAGVMGAGCGATVVDAVGALGVRAGSTGPEPAAAADAPNGVDVTDDAVNDVVSDREADGVGIDRAPTRDVCRECGMGDC
jgi:hypothetical protein